MLVSQPIHVQYMFVPTLSIQCIGSYNYTVHVCTHPIRLSIQCIGSFNYTVHVCTYPIHTVYWVAITIQYMFVPTLFIQCIGSYNYTVHVCTHPIHTVYW